MEKDTVPDKGISAEQLIDIQRIFVKIFDGESAGKIISDTNNQDLINFRNYLNGDMALVPLGDAELFQRVRNLLFKNNFLLKRFANECKKYSFNNQVKEWIAFYSDKKTYGFSQSRLEDFVANSNGKNPENENVQLIMSPSSTLSEDFAVLGKFTDIWFENKPATLTAFDPKWNWSKDRIMWANEDREAINCKMGLSKEKMLKSGDLFMDIRSRVQWQSFLHYVGKIPKNQAALDKQSVTLTTSLSGGGIMLSIGFGSESGLTRVYCDGASFSDGSFRPVELIYQN